MPEKKPINPLMAYDFRLLFPVLFLVGIGVVMVYSASSAIAHETYDNSYLFLKRQAIFALAGAAMLIVCRHVPYRWYRLLTYPLLAVALILLAAVHIPGLGVEAGGSTRWLRLGPVTFQPSELARLVLIMYLAYSMDRKQAQIKVLSIGYVPHMAVLALFMVLIITQPDFGSVVILATITWIMLFVGGVRIAYLAMTVMMLVPAAYYVLIHAAYRLKRLMSFLDPWQYPSAEGYQIIHSMMAFGTGGLWGTGVGKGYQKLFYLPEPHTDFIFSVIGEELGLVGVVIILGLYGLILWRGIGIARNASDTYGSFLALGLTVGIVLQVCVNMAVALGLLPTKGLTLPFLSYGGTSLLVNMAAVGILMNISSTDRRAAAGKRRSAHAAV
ncbi:MAG: putative lipid II flippase FtsW [Desulfobacterales bacterium]